MTRCVPSACRLLSTDSLPFLLKESLGEGEGRVGGREGGMREGVFGVCVFLCEMCEGGVIGW